MINKLTPKNLDLNLTLASFVGLLGNITIDQQSIIQLIYAIIALFSFFLTE